MTEKSDHELMDLVRDGDIEAFDCLYRRHQARMRRLLFSLTGDRDQAEDYLQEVFLGLWKARETYQPAAKLETFLFRIARNICCAGHRRQKLRRALPLPEDDGVMSLSAGESVEPEWRLVQGYRALRIRAAIDALPEAQRLVFVLAHLEGMDYARIAEALDIPVGTVKSRMHGAVQRLRGAIRETEL